MHALIWNEALPDWPRRAARSLPLGQLASKVPMLVPKATAPVIPDPGCVTVPWTAHGSSKIHKTSLCAGTIGPWERDAVKAMLNDFGFFAGYPGSSDHSRYLPAWDAYSASKGLRPVSFGGITLQHGAYLLTDWIHKTGAPTFSGSVPTYTYVFADGSKVVATSSVAAQQKYAAQQAAGKRAVSKLVTAYANAIPGRGEGTVDPASLPPACSPFPPECPDGTRCGVRPEISPLPRCFPITTEEPHEATSSAPVWPWLLAGAGVLVAATVAYTVAVTR